MPGNAPRGSTVEYTDHHIKKAEELLLPYLDEGVASRLLSIVGFRNEADNAFMIMGLVPWEERTVRQQQVTSEIREKLKQVPGVRLVAINPPGLGQRGFDQAMEMVIGGPDYDTVQQWSEELVARIRQDNPQLQNVETDFELTELIVDIDRNGHGSYVEDVGLTQTMLAG